MEDCRTVYKKIILFNFAVFLYAGVLFFLVIFNLFCDDFIAQINKVLLIVKAMLDK